MAEKLQGFVQLDDECVKVQGNHIEVGLMLSACITSLLDYNVEEEIIRKVIEAAFRTASKQGRMN